MEVPRAIALNSNSGNSDGYGNYYGYGNYSVYKT
jgi:hypothetical protein